MEYNWNTTGIKPNASDEYEYYDYEIDDSIPLDEIIPVGIVYGLTLMLGVSGNLLVIFSISNYRRMQSITNIFLVSLASADLLLVLLCIPIKFAKFFTHTWTFGEPLCKLVHYMQNVSVICSILTLTAISIERYYAILHPMKAKTHCTHLRAKKLIVGLWVLSLLLGTPILYGQALEEVGARIKAYWCSTLWPNDVIDKVYNSLMLIVIFILPLLLMTSSYAAVCKEMWNITSTRAALRHGLSKLRSSLKGRDRQASEEAPEPQRRRLKTFKDDDITRKQVIKMLVAVIILFAICWGPSFIDNVLVAFKVVGKLHYGHLRPMRMAFSLMSYANSCVNPVVYCFMSKNFRNSFQSALYSLIRRNRPTSNTDMANRRDSSYSRQHLSTTLTTYTARRSSLRGDDVEMREAHALLSRYIATSSALNVHKETDGEVVEDVTNKEEAATEKQNGHVASSTP